MITASGLEAAEEAARMVAAVRDDPAGRIRLAADAYAFGRGGRRYRPYRRAVVAFMRWQQARGVLNSLDDDTPGSRWWRAVNEDLLRDTVEAKLLIQRGDRQPSRPSVARWLSFFDGPSAQSWYGAHNASVVAGYLAHSALAALEAPAERFFMNVVLVRVLYAHALVLDGDLALGRLSFLARLIGHPRSRGPQALLSMKDVLPDRYPIHGAGIEELIDSENRLGRMVDYGVIGARVDALYATSARALGEPLLLDLIAGRSARLRLAGRSTSRVEASATAAVHIVDRIPDPPPRQPHASGARDGLMPDYLPAHRCVTITRKYTGTYIGTLAAGLETLTVLRALGPSAQFRAGQLHS